MSEKQQALKSSELKKKIKEMESKKRDEILKKAAKVNVIQPAGEDSGKLSFDEWWMLTSKKLSMKPWLKEVVWADFNGRKLSKLESLEKYNHALRQFGYNI